MVKHIVAWNVKEEFAKEKREVGLEAKRQLEALTTAVPGIISIKVIVNEMESSTVDVTLICEFESKEVLAAYQVSPEHLKAAEYIKAHMCNRTCIDYEE